MPPLEPYSISTKIAFWFLWLICAAFLLLVVRMVPMLNIAFWSMPKGGGDTMVFIGHIRARRHPV
jgi:hypothetical protein